MNPVWQQIYLERGGKVSLVQQLANAIRHAIATSRLAPGELLPSVRQLAALLEVTPATVNRAYLLLGREKLLVTHFGSSTKVADIGDLDAAAQALAGELVEATLSRSVADLVGLGFGLEQVVEALRAQVERIQAADSVLFAAESAPLLEKYERILGEQLRPLGFDATSCLVSEIARHPAESGLRLQSTALVTCLLSSKSEVEHALAAIGFHLPVVPLLTELTQPSLSEIRALDQSLAVLVLAEPKFRAVITGTLRTVAQPRSIAYYEGAVDGPASKVRTRGVDVLVHTLGYRDLALEVRSPSMTTIELEYLPRQGSLNRLVAMLAGDKRRLSGPL